MAILPNILPPPGLEGVSSVGKAGKRRRGTHPSPAKLLRDAARQQRLLTRAGHSGAANLTPCDASSDFVPRLVGAVQSLVLSSGGVLHEAFHACSRAVKTKGRVRDIFPLPLLARWPTNVLLKHTGAEPALVFANFCLVSLNALWADFKEGRLLAAVKAVKPTAPQLQVQVHVAEKVARMLTRSQLSAGSSWTWCGAFDKFEQGSFVQSQPLVGAAVDLPRKAATCDPVLHVPAELREMLRNASSIFPAVPAGELGPCCRHQEDPEQYAILIAREVKCGKIRLRRQANGVAPIFAVGKSAAGRQRKIWNGSELSSIAAKPPPPPRLANPSSFLDLHVGTDTPVFYSKRDAETFFDVLKVPDELCPWFGQPPLSAGELMQAGNFTVELLASLTDDLHGSSLREDDLLVPVSMVWPMGFSWSSTIAQNTTIACVKAAEDAILAMEHPVPHDQSELCMVATDDTVFMHRDRKKGLATLARFDSSLDNAGIPRNLGKDITLVEQVTALGCDISSRPHVAEPTIPKLMTCISAVLDVLDRRAASPKALHGLLGLLQWLCLLQRPVFGVFDNIYKFVSHEPGRRPAEIPDKVLKELAVALGLLPLLCVRLDKQYANDLLACDAAPEFGFGVSVKTCSDDLLHRLGCLAERCGDYVRVHKEPGEMEKSRLGTPHRLPLRKRDFRTLVSAPAKWKAHSSTLEGHALLLTLKWLSRSAKKHHKKVVVLVDAKAVLGAVAKGRTSAPGLRSVVRAIGAHELACDWIAVACPVRGELVRTD
ncbi:unnamed protein product, partial [Symbiodinium pilosum]